MIPIVSHDWQVYHSVYMATFKQMRSIHAVSSMSQNKLVHLYLSILSLTDVYTSKRVCAMRRAVQQNTTPTQFVSSGVFMIKQECLWCVKRCVCVFVVVVAVYVYIVRRYLKSGSQWISGIQVSHVIICYTIRTKMNAKEHQTSEHEASIWIRIQIYHIDTIANNNKQHFQVQATI